MQFNKHLGLEGKHAFLSPSNHHWTNYTEQKLATVYRSRMGAQRGTDLHNLAHEAIRLGVPLDPVNEALAWYVNDAIALGMVSEQILFYSPNCFGTADAIVFRDMHLRIHDLKNGITPTSFKQLEVYAALFCLEYNVSPFDIEMELRIYQRDEVRTHVPFPEAIEEIMNKIISSDLYIEAIKEG